MSDVMGYGYCQRINDKESKIMVDIIDDRPKLIGYPHMYT